MKVKFNEMAIFLCLIILSIGSASFASSTFSPELQTKLKESIVLFIDSPNAIVNSNESIIDNTNENVCPIIRDGRTLVPVRFISENLGAKVNWDDKTSTIIVNLKDKQIKLAINDKKIIVNNVQSQLDVPAQIIEERTFIPLRALVEALGKNVFWDDRGLIVISESENLFNEVRDKDLINEAVILFKSKQRGNTIGNLSNEGLVAKQGEWIYYSNLIDGALYKSKEDSSNKVKLLNSYCTYLNVIDNWIYFSNSSDKNRLYKISTSGENKTLLDKDEIFDIEVIGEWIYYIDSTDDNNIFKMKVDGSNKTRLTDSGEVGNINVKDNVIFYTSRVDGKIYTMKSDGTDRVEVVNGIENVVALNVVNNFIFFSNYTSQDNKAILYKTEFYGKDISQLSKDTIYLINVSGDWIYYNNGSDNGKLYRMKLDGSNNTQVNIDSSLNIQVINDWVYYVNTSTDDRLWRVRVDGTGREKVE